MSIQSRPVSRLRAAIFDLGGTLVDFAGEGETWWDVERRAFARAHAFLTEHHAEAAWEPFFERIKQINDAYWVRATAGEQSFVVDHVVRDACAEMGLEPDEALVRGCVDAFCAVVADACWPFPESRATLEAMRARGLKVGLISNTMVSGRVHQEDMRRFGLLEHFDHTIFSGDVGLWKPDRRIFELSLEALGVAPDEAFFVGDRIVDDVGGAQGAGLRAVLRRSERADVDYGDPRAASIRPDAQIATIGELVSVVDQWLSTREP